MNEQLSQLVTKLQGVKNVLVTVSKDPSIDQVAAAIGLTIGLNNLGKHATAVYSGQTPSTVEFLKPEETLEKNTDSLRDFIIALDKSKADKLRYKVEDDVVRIYVTPYKTSISERDLQFSQGDFNVEMVLALGVHSQDDLDEAIRAHGRIFHSATVVSVDVGEGSDVGTLNWFDSSASSLSEMAADLLGKLDSKSLDSQVATALLTGVVATTDRFSNDKTSPRTMSTSAALMAAGANQQLISVELDSAKNDAADAEPERASNDVLDVNHDMPDETSEVQVSHEGAEAADATDSAAVAVEEEVNEASDKPSEITVDDDGHLRLLEEVEAEKAQKLKVELPQSDVAELKLPTPAGDTLKNDAHAGEDDHKSIDDHEPDFLALSVEPGSDAGAVSENQHAPVSPAANLQPVEAPDATASSNNVLSGNAGVSSPAEAYSNTGQSPPLSASTVGSPGEPSHPVRPQALVETNPIPKEGPVPTSAGSQMSPSESAASSLDDARNAVEAALNGGESPLEVPEPAQGATMSHKAPTLTPPSQPSLGVMPPMPPLPDVPEPKLAPPPTGFVPPMPVAPSPAPLVSGVPSLPPQPSATPATSLVPPVPSGNIVTPDIPVVQPPAGPQMAPPPMAPPILPS